MQANGMIEQITRSVSKGVSENLKGQVALIKDFGIAGDAHGKKGARQLSLMTKIVARQLDQVRDQGLCTKRFKANIIISDVDKSFLQVGAVIVINGAQLEITEMGKTCFGCHLSENNLFCPLVDDVVFAAVCEEGVIQQGDKFYIKL